MKTTNIYILLDPETQQVRYVGKANNVSQRFKAHLNKARKHQKHKSNWINSLKRKGLKPIIEVIDVVSIEDWIFWETYWISQFKSWGFKLLNYTLGGDGATFANQTSFKKGNKSWNEGLGNTWICEECHKPFKASISSKRKYCSQICTSIAKSKNPNLGTFKNGTKSWNAGKSGYKTSRRRKVIQMDINNNFIREFESVKEASEAVNCSRGNIEAACNNKVKVAKKFKWKYKDE